MLQSEFFERTHITLTGEEYADVECLYNAVKMDKDEFCKRWVSERKNPLFKELADAYVREVRRHQSNVASLQATCAELRKEYDNFANQKAKEIEDIIKKNNANFNAFGEKIICLNLDDKKLYDIIEEEFSLKFIIQTKHNAGIPLSDDEISYLVGKL